MFSRLLRVDRALARCNLRREHVAVSEDEQPRDEGDDVADEADEGRADQGPVDQLGIPMSRAPTLDDVRGDSEPHRRLAIGCTLAVLALLLAFYLVRTLVLR